MVSTRARNKPSAATEAVNQAPRPGHDASGSWTRIFVTGANAGLGLDTCRRIIIEFLNSGPDTQHLHLIVGTRSTAKSAATIKTLLSHTRNSFPSLLPKPNDTESRLLITSAELDLTQLPSVIHAARSLRETLPDLHAIICNAGISGWTGLYWPWTVWMVITDYMEAVTFPPYMRHALGLRTKPQLPEGSGIQEPPLNEVFCANVFGHYLLAHELGPLLAAAGQNDSDGTAGGRLIWTSSTEATQEDFLLSDIQCLDRSHAYNSSKRLTDLLALSSTLDSTRPLINSFFSDPQTSTRGKPVTPLPRQYVTHPGVVSTDIVKLHPVVAWAKRMSFYIARYCGSPWHNITGYRGATASAWVALSPQSVLDGLEKREGVAKWGSACDWKGNERVKRTEVEGWGFGGRVEPSAPLGEHRKGRKRSAKDLTLEEREAFEKAAAECWKQMEELRKQWMELMTTTGAI